MTADPALCLTPPSKGDSIWYEPGTNGEFDLPIGGQVLSADAGQIQLKLATGEVRRRRSPLPLFALSSQNKTILKGKLD